MSLIEPFKIFFKYAQSGETNSAFVNLSEIQSVSSDLSDDELSSSVPDRE